MTLFDRDELKRARKLAQQVSAEAVDPADEAQLDEIIGRSLWSGIGEPGDRFVGRICDALGAMAALDTLAAGTPAHELARAVAVATGDEADENDDEIAEALERWLPRLRAADALGHLERAQRIGASILIPPHALWPEGLARLGDHAPVALWLRGSVDALATLDKSLSIVGARASTGYGEHVTMDVVTTLVDRGFAIVSGAAYGIDGMAHRAALSSQGTTIAVLAGGIDRLYPSGHDALLKRIIDAGLVVTELPCGFAPTKWRFLQRNRLIAALSCATIVVEAGWRSGSLNTAHHALDMDIPVGAIPGPVTSASSAGTHRLLRETPAVCVTTANEIAQLVSSDCEEPLVPELVHPHATRLLDSLSRTRARSHEELVTLAGLTSMQVMATLGLLELQGSVRQNATGWLRT